MNTLLLVAFGFFMGSLPFSVWLGRYALGEDIRQYGDRNPGATNVLRAGGARWGGLALLLDFMKGAIPVALANFGLHLDDISLLIVAMSPILGHAYSPFLNFKGGKALATAGGVWCGLTIWEVPTVAGLLLGFWFAFINESAWAVMALLVSLLAYLLLAHPDPLLLAMWALNSILVVWKHRSELRQPPTLRSWYRNLVLPWHS